MQDWHNRVGDILAYVNGVLHPHGFEAIEKDDFAALRQMLQRARSELRPLLRSEAHGASGLPSIKHKSRYHPPLHSATQIPAAHESDEKNANAGTASG